MKLDGHCARCTREYLSEERPLDGPGGLLDPRRQTRIDCGGWRSTAFRMIGFHNQLVNLLLGCNAAGLSCAECRQMDRISAVLCEGKFEPIFMILIG